MQVKFCLICSTLTAFRYVPRELNYLTKMVRYVVRRILDLYFHTLLKAAPQINHKCNLCFPAIQNSTAQHSSPYSWLCLAVNQAPEFYWMKGKECITSKDRHTVIL